MPISKAEFFYRPETPGDICRGRKAFQRHFGLRDLARVVEELEDDEYLEIDFPLIPRPEFSSNYALKHGNPLRLKYYSSAQEAIADKRPPWEQRNEAFESLQQEQRESPAGFVYRLGLHWKGFGTDTTTKTVYLTDVCDAVMLYVFSEVYAPDRDKIIVRPYPPLELSEEERKGVSISEIRRTGRKIMCTVPSRTMGRHQFAITNVPTEDSPEKYALALGMQNVHSCGDTANLNTRFGGAGIRFRNAKVEDEHVIAAYLRTIEIFQADLDRRMEPHYKRQRERGVAVHRKACVPMEMNPYPLPTQDEMNFHVKCLSQILIWDKTRSKGRAHGFRRPLNEAEIELLHMNRVALRGTRQTFWAAKKIRDYDIPPIEKAA